MKHTRHNRICVGWLVLLVLATCFYPVSSAQAGILDWLKRKIDYQPSVKNDREGMVFPVIVSEASLPLLQNTSLIAASTPIIFGRFYIPAKTWKVRVLVSAYSSTIDQTDYSPFITASGTHVRDGVVATNFLPLGTIIRIPELYGDKIFVVEDRMSKRYYYHVDLWFPSREAAKNFGVQEAQIEIIS